MRPISTYECQENVNDLTQTYYQVSFRKKRIRWQCQLKNPTASAVGFRGIGTLPNKQFLQKICNRQAYYIACQTFCEQIQTHVVIVRISVYNVRKRLVVSIWMRCQSKKPL